MNLLHNCLLNVSSARAGARSAPPINEPSERGSVNHIQKALVNVASE